MGIQRISDIAQILLTRKDIEAREGTVIWMFMRYLENLGLVRGKDFDVDSVLNELNIDLVIYDSNRKPVIVIDVLEPNDHNSSLRDKEFLSKIERILVRTYIYALSPDYVIITDGFSLLVYDKTGSRLNNLSTLDLASVDDGFESKIKDILLKWNSKS